MDAQTDYEIVTYQGGYATVISPDGCDARVMRFADNGRTHVVLKTFTGETAHQDAERLVLSYVLRLVHG